MKKQVKYIILMLTLTMSIQGYAQELQEKLKTLGFLVEKQWQGKLWAPDSSKSFIIERTFKPILDGKVIKMQKINHELSNIGEGYIYYEPLENKIAFFFIGNKGVYSKGFVNIEDSLISFEGIMTWPEQKPPFKQSYEIKNTFELNSSNLLIDKWYHNAFGEWKQGHTIEYSCKK